MSNPDLTGSSPPYTKTTLSQWVNEWCQDIVNDAAANGVVVKPVIYTYTSYSTEWLDSTVWKLQPLWMAQYPANPNPQTGVPSSTNPWNNWAFWQFNFTNTILSGITRDCDVDVFNGTTAGLVAFSASGLSAPYFISQPLNDLARDTGDAVSFSATAWGTPPLTYQWLLNDAIIPDATNGIFTINGVQSTNAGDYSVVAMNSLGSVTSSVVSCICLSILKPVVFSDKFDTNTADQRAIKSSWADTAGAFNFDYSALGIPSAPRTPPAARPAAFN